ncbi:unnamed protein product [Onchocerca flexuosa]|uniref:Dickkopf_N domain-containing protein n=1 Tax=Onchocerca flexuosa TaxID=387005 RepID=A0A183HDZ9_9BILA|nr:unnamed protein product [Onchocerca flexuosa]
MLAIHKTLLQELPNKMRRAFSSNFRKYCISNTQCDPSERCIPDISGLLLCQQVSEQIPTTPKQITCQNDAQCPEFGKCIRLGWYGSCQYQSSGLKNSGTVNDRCYSDADCAQYLHCINRNGMMTCQVIAGMPSHKICQSDADCDTLQMCSFNAQYNTNLCATSPEYQTARVDLSWKNIGSGVIPSNLIGNGALPMKFEKQCTADYQCSVFEICAEGNIQGNRICKYNPTSSNRQCRFNADCQAGQVCPLYFHSIMK